MTNVDQLVSWFGVHGYHEFALTIAKMRATTRATAYTLTPNQNILLMNSLRLFAFFSFISA